MNRHEYKYFCRQIISIFYKGVYLIIVVNIIFCIKKLEYIYMLLFLLSSVSIKVVKAIRSPLKAKLGFIK